MPGSRSNRTRVVAVYNNKGGVGKSSLTLGLAEFLSANQKKNVLVIDLDAQASTSGALIPRAAFGSAIENGRTLPVLMNHLLQNGKLPENLQDYFLIRDDAKAKGSSLKELSIIVPDRERRIELEDKLTDRNGDRTLLRDHLKPRLQGVFDYVLLDLPSNVDRRQRTVVNGLMMADFVVIPVKPDHTSLDALPETFRLIEYARQINNESDQHRHAPHILGMVLNMTHRGSRQYTQYFKQIDRESKAGRMPPVFDNFLGHYPKIDDANDVLGRFRTLKQRFFNQTLYDKVRKVAVELNKRCEEYQPHGKAEPVEYSRRIEHILDQFTSR